MAYPVYNVLFICAKNSSAGILAKSLLNQLGLGRYRAFSASVDVCADCKPNPLVLSFLERQRMPIDGLRCKSHHVFGLAGAPLLDLVVFLDEEAQAYAAFDWPGSPQRVVWELNERSTGEESGQSEAAIAELFEQLKNQVAGFLELPMTNLAEVPFPGKSLGRE